MIPEHEKARIRADGRWAPDDRFAIREYGAIIIIGLHAKDETLLELHESLSWAEALAWMTHPSRPRPDNSLRVGDAVKKITQTLGLQTCAPCAARQIALNNALRFGSRR